MHSLEYRLATVKAACTRVSQIPEFWNSVPEGAGAGRDIESARDGRSGRDVEPNGFQRRSAVFGRTGRDIAPMDGSDESDDDDAASVSRSSLTSSEVSYMKSPFCHA